jgi:hypothetical protein
MKTLMFGEDLDTLTETQCIDAVSLRRRQIQECVGTLYPDIMRSEIDLLLERLDKLRFNIPIQKALPFNG